MLPLPAPRVLDQFFLEARSKLLDLAAILDRIGRGEGAADTANDARSRKIARAMEILLSGSPNKAELIQQLFSQDYDPNWKRPEPRF